MHNNEIERKNDMKQKIFLALIMCSVLTACKDSFLDRKPQGGTIRQDQYDVIDEKVEGTVRGLFVKLYSMGGSSHDEFGKRSIDLWGDILCGDIAVTNPNYGWLVSDEQMQTMTNRTGTIWGHYYGMIHNANLTLKNCFDRDSILTHLADPTYVYTEEEEHMSIMYAQALALRGYCYAQLAKWYTPVEGCTYIKDKTIATYDCCPIYLEDNMNSPQPLATSDSVYERAFADMETAVALFRRCGDGYHRPSKLLFDKSVICGLLAQAYLNQCVYTQDQAKQTAHIESARDLALEAIASSGCKIIPYEELLTSGFNNIDNKSWMWGQHVTVETAGGLKSWFGQVDIHSYSYAWAGATKAIDGNLRKEMDKEEMWWDKRYSWFRTTKAYNGCPDKKFFSDKNPTSTNTDSIDREWLSDNVFMRIESMYMIAAEAYYRLGDYDNSVLMLKNILDQRFDPEEASSYEAYLNSLTSAAKLKDALIYNWRVEFWGEGYGLETFRRWKIEGRVRGDNHYYRSGAIKATEDRFNMNIPSGEATYNPFVDAKEEE